MENNPCKICGGEREKIFRKKILGKYDVDYFKCTQCGFIQTEKPYWLEESYSSAITSMDIGLVGRNTHYSEIVEDILYKYFNPRGRFLDFAGGYGMFTRIMRDKGFDFFHEDKYCENLFVKYFDIEDLPIEKRKFELITAFEFMEHIEDPVKNIENIFSMTDSFLFSTELVPENDIENWWYLGTEHGQHISFYTRKSLKRIAAKYGKVYYANGNLHLITNKKRLDIFNKLKRCEKYYKKMKELISPPKKMKSRLQDDFQIVIKKEIK